MKADTLAAILFRVLGVFLLLRSIYGAFAFLNVFLSSHSQLGEAETFPVFLRYLIFGVAIYFASPILGKIAAWKIRE